MLRLGFVVWGSVSHSFRRIEIGPWNRTAGLLGTLGVCIVSSSSVAYSQRDLKEIPSPDPVGEIAAMTPDPAAKVALFASDPDFRKPIQVNFDSRGRLWVASSEVYPQIKPGEKANDKIVVLEDTDGDGISDKSVVFAEGLLIPTGVVPDGSGGAYVGASTELLHFSDTNGDGRADKRRVVLSGFGTEDTHHLVHTLRWGPDGCLYFNQSIYIHSHIETPYGTRHLEGGGIWRYRPETGDLSVLCKGFVNPWGHVFNEYGESLATDGAYVEGINYVFPGAVFATAPGETRFVKGMNPGSPKHCGLEILSGTHIPPSWSGDLVTSDFRGHRVCRFTLSPDQSSYTSRQQSEVLTSSHIAFRPIDARMGPDGALYIADWYNPIIQHGEVDFRDERRDREHGRIWRVSFDGRPLDPWPDFASATRDDLILWLESPSLAVRQFARQQLWPMVRSDADGVLAAVKHWRDTAENAAVRSSRALEQQWLGEVAGRFEREAFEMVMSGPPMPATRASLRSASRSAVPGDEIVQDAALRLVASDHAPSRMEAVIVLGQMGNAESSEALVRAAQLLGAPSIGDPLTDFALWQALRSTKNEWNKSLRDGRVDWKTMANGVAYAATSAGTSDAAASLLELLRSQQVDETQRRVFADAISATGDAGALGELLRMALAGSTERSASQAAAIIKSLVSRTRKDRTLPAKADALLLEIFSTSEELPQDASMAQALIAAIGEWKSIGMVPVLIEWLERSDQPVIRHAILKTLGQFDDGAAKRTLLTWAKEFSRAEAITAVEAIAVKQPSEAAKVAVDLFASSDDDEGVVGLLVSLLANVEVSKAIPAMIAEQSLRVDRARAMLSAARKQGGGPEIEAAIRTAGRLEETGWALTPELSAELIRESGTQGDVVAGEGVYRREALQCIQCHAIGAGGGLVGPNLISLGASSQPDYIVESLLDPNARLKEGYNTVAVLTDDGRVTSGIPVGRDAKSLTLRLADGKEVTLPVDAIESEQPGKSLMPLGVLDTLTKKELVDLVAFLSALGRKPDLTVSTQAFVRSFETLVFSSDANSRLNRTSFDKAASDEPVFRWRPITTRVNATLPLDELDRYQPYGDRAAPTSFIRFDLDVPDGQVSKLTMPVDAIEVWINGRPMPPSDLIANGLEAGKYRIVIGINRQAFAGQWRVLVE